MVALRPLTSVPVVRPSALQPAAMRASANAHATRARWRHTRATPAHRLAGLPIHHLRPDALTFLFPGGEASPAELLVASIGRKVQPRCMHVGHAETLVR